MKLKTTFSVVFLSLFFLPLIAQPTLEESEVIFIKEAKGARVDGCSPNGDYLLFSGKTGTSGIWHRPTNKVRKLCDLGHDTDAEDLYVQMIAVNDSGWAVGFKANASPMGEYINQIPVLYKYSEDKYYDLELPEDYTQAPFYENLGYGISDDGRRVSGIYYLPDFDPKYPEIWRPGMSTKGLVQYKTCTWYDGKFERVYDLPWTLTNGGRPNGISGNGMVMPAWGERAEMIKVPGYDTGLWQMAVRTPIIHKIVGDTTYAIHFMTGGETFEKIEDRYKYEGEMFATNYDGSIVVGYLNYEAVAWKSDGTPTGGKLTKLKGPSSNTVDGIALTVAENGWIGGRGGQALVWQHIDSTPINLATMITEQYYLDLEGNYLEDVSAMSSDGSTYYGNSGAGPYMAYLNGEPNGARPTEPYAYNTSDKKSVLIGWKTPLQSEKFSLEGYIIYCNGDSVGSVGVRNTYTHTSPTPIGLRAYSVAAIYNNGTVISKPTKQVFVEFVGETGGYSPKTIQADLIYNQVLNLTWGTPTSIVSDTANYPRLDLTVLAMNSKYDQKAYQKEVDTMKRYQFLDPMPTTVTNESAIAVDQDGYYTASFSNNILRKYTLYGRLIEEKRLPISKVMNICLVGDTLFALDNTARVYAINKNNMTAVRSFSAKYPVQSIAYIPDFDGAPAFLLANAFKSYYARMNGDSIKPGPEFFTLVSLTYYHDTIFAMEQQGASQYITGSLYAYSPKTNESYGLQLDYPRVAPFIGTWNVVGAGISVGKSEDGTTAIFSTAQYEANTYVFPVELKKADNLIGYNIYRNNTLVAEKYPYRNYQEIMDTPGTYKYKVSAVYQDNIESNKTREVSVTVKEKGECNAVAQVAAEASYGYARMAWSHAETSGQDLAGYFVYLNGEKVSPLLNANTYTYKLGNKEGTHVFTVEAFYESACQATKDVEVIINNNGRCLPVSDLMSQKDAQENIILNWGYPYFDNPLPLSYHDGVVNGLMGATEATDYWAVIGWSANELNEYDQFKVVGLEFYLEDKPRSLSMVAIVNDELVRDQRIAVTSLLPGYNVYMFDEPLVLNTKDENVWGLKMDIRENQFIVGVDAYTSRPAYSDLISVDGKEWYWTNSGDWMISALLTKIREPQVEKSPDLNTPVRMITRVDKKMSTWARMENFHKNTESAKAPSVDYRLLGFNVYRGNEKITPSPITARTYTDAKPVADAISIYTVATVWADGQCEEQNASINVSMEGSSLYELKVYPNPTSSLLHIESSETPNRVNLYDIQGRLVFEGKNMNILDVNPYKSGLYILKVQIKGESMISKIQIIK